MPGSKPPSRKTPGKRKHRHLPVPRELDRVSRGPKITREQGQSRRQCETQWRRLCDRAGVTTDIREQARILGELLQLSTDQLADFPRADIFPLLVREWNLFVGHDLAPEAYDLFARQVRSEEIKIIPPEIKPMASRKGMSEKRILEKKELDRVTAIKRLNSMVSPEAEGYGNLRAQFNEAWRSGTLNRFFALLEKRLKR